MRKRNVLAASAFAGAALYFAAIERGRVKSREENVKQKSPDIKPGQESKSSGSVRADERGGAQDAGVVA